VFYWHCNDENWYIMLLVSDIWWQIYEILHPVAFTGAHEDTAARQSCVIKFLISEGASGFEIHRRPSVTVKENIRPMLQPPAFQWTAHFSESEVTFMMVHRALLTLTQTFEVRWGRCADVGIAS
jgi:hypothetical protein